MIYCVSASCVFSNILKIGINSLFVDYNVPPKIKERSHHFRQLFLMIKKFLLYFNRLEMLQTIQSYHTQRQTDCYHATFTFVTISKDLEPSKGELGTVTSLYPGEKRKNTWSDSEGRVWIYAKRQAILEYKIFIYTCIYIYFLFSDTNSWSVRGPQSSYPSFVHYFYCIDLIDLKKTQKDTDYAKWCSVHKPLARCLANF